MRDDFIRVSRYLIPVSPRDSTSNSASGKGLAEEASYSQVSNSGISASSLEITLSRQMERKMIASIAVITALSDSDGRVQHASLGIDRRNLVSLPAAFSQNLSSNEHHEAYVRDLISEFDVDGLCVVAIPRNADLEILPRPALRSISVCWVVEPVICTENIGREEREHNGSRSDPAGSECSARKETIRDYKAESNGLRGQRGVSSELIIRLVERAGLSTQRSTLREDNEKPLDECGEEYETLYRVLNKVRGPWQIKNYPMHRYKFI